MLLLGLLLLELLLELRRDRGHRRRTGLEVLLLLLRLLRLKSSTLHGKPGELLLQRSLSETRGLGRERTGLLLLLLLQRSLSIASSLGRKRTRLLLSTRSLAISA